MAHKVRLIERPAFAGDEESEMSKTTPPTAGFRLTAEIDAQLQALLLVNRRLVEALHRFDVNRFTPANEAAPKMPAAQTSAPQAAANESAKSAEPRSRTAA